MHIREVTDPDTLKLVALSQFLLGRTNDESARKQISKNAFIKAAKSLGVNVTMDNLGDLISKEPLKNIMEPMEPNSNVLRFRGNTETETGMTVDQARAVVDSNAKQAMKRRQK